MREKAVRACALNNARIVCGLGRKCVFLTIISCLDLTILNKWQWIWLYAPPSKETRAHTPTLGTVKSKIWYRVSKINRLPLTEEEERRRRRLSFLFRGRSGFRNVAACYDSERYVRMDSFTSISCPALLSSVCVGRISAVKRVCRKLLSCRSWRPRHTHLYKVYITNLKQRQTRAAEEMPKTFFQAAKRLSQYLIWVRRLQTNIVWLSRRFQHHSTNQLPHLCPVDTV